MSIQNISGFYDFKYWDFKNSKDIRFYNSLYLNSWVDNFGIEAELRYLEVPMQNFGNVYGEDFSGIYRKTLVFQRNEVEIRALNYYYTPGKGLVLSSTYDEVSRIDRFMEGLFFSFYNSRIKFNVFYGYPMDYLNFVKEKFIGIDSLTEFYGIEGYFRLLKNFEIGGYYIRNHNYISQSKKKNFMASVLRTKSSFIEFYSELVFRKGYDIALLKDTNGFGNYTNISISIGEFMILLEGVYYNLLGTKYSLPPCLNKYGLSLTQARREQGFRINFLFPVFDYFYFDINYSNTFYRDLRYIKEFYFDLSYKKGFLESNLIYHNLSLLNAGIDAIKRKENRVFFEILMSFVDISYGAGIEYRFRNDFISESLEHKYYEPKIYLQLLHHKGYISLNYQEDKDKKVYVFTEVFFQINYNLSMKLYYGSQRKDIVCSGGICRFEPSFKGFKFVLNYSF